MRNRIGELIMYAGTDGMTGDNEWENKLVLHSLSSIF